MSSHYTSRLPLKLKKCTSPCLKFTLPDVSQWSHLVKRQPKNILLNESLHSRYYLTIIKPLGDRFKNINKLSLLPITRLPTNHQQFLYVEQYRSLESRTAI